MGSGSLRFEHSPVKPLKNISLQRVKKHCLGVADYQQFTGSYIVGSQNQGKLPFALRWRKLDKVFPLRFDEMRIPYFAGLNLSAKANENMDSFTTHGLSLVPGFSPALWMKMAILYH